MKNSSLRGECKWINLSWWGGKEEIIFVTSKGCFFIGIFLPKLSGIHQKPNSLISVDTMFHILVAK